MKTVKLPEGYRLIELVGIGGSSKSYKVRRPDRTKSHEMFDVVDAVEWAEEDAKKQPGLHRKELP